MVRGKRSLKGIRDSQFVVGVDARNFFYKLDIFGFAFFYACLNGLHRAYAVPVFLQEACYGAGNNRFADRGADPGYEKPFTVHALFRLHK